MVDEVLTIRRVVGFEEGEAIVVVTNIQGRVAEGEDCGKHRGSGVDGGGFLSSVGAGHG